MPTNPRAGVGGREKEKGNEALPTYELRLEVGTRPSLLVAGCPPVSVTVTTLGALAAETTTVATARGQAAGRRAVGLLQCGGDNLRREVQVRAEVLQKKWEE